MLLEEVRQPVTVQEAALFYKRREETIRRWIHTGKLPASTLPNGEYRIKHEDLMAMVAATADPASSGFPGCRWSD